LGRRLDKFQNTRQLLIEPKLVKDSAQLEISLFDAVESELF